MQCQCQILITHSLQILRFELNWPLHNTRSTKKLKNIFTHWEAKGRAWRRTLLQLFFPLSISPTFPTPEAVIGVTDSWQQHLTTTPSFLSRILTITSNVTPLRKGETYPVRRRVKGVANPLEVAAIGQVRIAEASVWSWENQECSELNGAELRGGRFEKIGENLGENAFWRVETSGRMKRTEEKWGEM